MPRSAPPPTTNAPVEKATGLHPRNRHQGRYDFDALIRETPELGAFVILNPYGNRSIDFASPQAVRTLNRALLRQLYGIRHWDIPEGYLCPPIPGRADYIHGLADLLAGDNGSALPKNPAITALDIGVGANCIYPLLGNMDYGWRFVGTDVDDVAIAAARTIVQSNGLDGAIKLRKQSHTDSVLNGIIAPGERFELVLSNPPFHSNPDEARTGSQRKWKNLGKQDPGRKLPTLNFGGQSNELWRPGGELQFLRRMIKESTAFATQVLWFTSLVSKGGNIAPLQEALKRANAVQVRIVEMAQGQKRSRFLAWSFLDDAQRQQWMQAL
jgi:23S rRNA (adenine1618-N6)-methyltransferase